MAANLFRKLWGTSRTLHPYFNRAYDVILLLKRAWSFWSLAGARFSLLMWWSHICDIIKHRKLTKHWHWSWSDLSFEFIDLWKRCIKGIASTRPPYRWMGTKPFQVSGTFSHLIATTVNYYWFRLLWDDQIDCECWDWVEAIMRAGTRQV